MENLFYWKPANTVVIDKCIEKWRIGIWIGFIEDSNEHLIGTPNGIVKCYSVRRLDEVGNFDKKQIEEIRGTPWEPVPGRKSLHIPTNIEADGRIVNDKGEVEGQVE